MVDPQFNWSPAQMILLAQRGMSRVQRSGARGASMITLEEGVAMAAVLAMLGLPSVDPQDKQITPKSHTPIDGEKAL